MPTEAMLSPKLIEIKVTGLFDVFDYTIPLFVEDRITIILGQNGLGKSTLLKLVSDFFSGNYAEMALCPFATLTLGFNDKTYVEIKRPGAAAPDQPLQAALKISASGQDWDFEVLSEEQTLRALRSLPPTERYRDIRNQIAHRRVFSMADLRQLEQQDPRLWTRLMEMTVSEPDWLSAIRKRFPATFIPSDRLNPSSVQHGEDDDVRRRRPEPVLSYYAKLVARRIGSAVDTYAERSQALDRSFLRRLAKRFIEIKSGKSQSSGDVSKDLSSLEKSRSRLSTLGLLEAELEFLRPEELNAVPPAVVELHVSDNIDKLDVFSDIARRVELLYLISRERLKFKRLSIDKTEGLTVSARDPDKPGSYRKHLLLSDLSSGEQHHLVLLTKLLFDVPSNSLVLIDEPEISMHIVWQHELVSDLKKIADHIDADLLIATHSPQILGDFGDQTVPLDEQVRLEP